VVGVLIRLQARWYGVGIPARFFSLLQIAHANCGPTNSLGTRR